MIIKSLFARPKKLMSNNGRIFFLVMMFFNTFSHNLALADSASDYPHLSENLSASKSYEIVKLVDNSIEAVLYHEQSENIIISTGEHLGKINRAGELTDYFKTRSSYYSSGIGFSQDHYNDWIFTGQKENKPYDKKIDARGYSTAKLFELFNEVEIVEFSTNNRHERKAYAHLYSKGNVILVDISDKAEKIHSRCHISDRRWERFGWDDVCFDGYRENKKLTILDDMASWGRSSLTEDTETQPPLTLMKFKRKKYTLDKGISGALMGVFLLPALGYSSEMPNAYWFGDAYFKLTHRKEALKFTLFADNEGEFINHRNFSIYQPENTLFDETKILVVNYRFDQHVESEVKFNKYYDKEVGLYVLRKKGSHSSAIIKPRTTRWQPAFSGIKSSKAITGSYSFFDRQLTMQYYTLSRQGKGKAALFSLPKTLSLDWHTKKQQERFLLKLKGTKTAVYQDATDNTEVSFAIGFDEEEVRHSFASITNELEVNSSDEIIKLEVQFEPLSTNSAQLKVGFASKKEFIELKKISIHPIGNLKRTKVDSTALKSQYKRASEDSTKFNTLFLEVNRLSKKADYVENYVAKITYYFIMLINQYNSAHNFSASVELARFYAKNVFPSIVLLGESNSIRINNSNIASQMLVASIYLNDTDSQQLLFDTLLGDSFNMDQSENGTLVFNLACFYALKQDKKNMLATIKKAMELGKPKNQFLGDKDFKVYYQDDDFLRVINQYH